MRVDKFMWAVRVFKTRSMSSKHCREGKVTCGDQTLKPARDLKVGEVVEVRKGAVRFRYEVLSFPRSFFTYPGSASLPSTRNRTK